MCHGDSFGVNRRTDHPPVIGTETRMPRPSRIVTTSDVHWRESPVITTEDRHLCSPRLGRAEHLDIGARTATLVGTRPSSPRVRLPVRSSRLTTIRRSSRNTRAKRESPAGSGSLSPAHDTVTEAFSSLSSYQLVSWAARKRSRHRSEKRCHAQHRRALVIVQRLVGHVVGMAEHAVVVAPDQNVGSRAPWRPPR